MTWWFLKVLTWTNVGLNMNSMQSTSRDILYAGFSLLWLCSTAMAQDDFIDSSGEQEMMIIEGHTEKQYTMKLEVSPATKKYCHVSVNIDYLQKNSDVIVNMALDNPDCAASSGSYAVAVRFRDENNNSQTVEYEETWQREDDQPLQKRQSYYVGENVDVINARVKRPNCVCTATPSEKEDTLPPTPNP